MALVERLITRLADSLSVLTQKPPEQKRTLILGAGHGPALLADQLSREGLPVTIIDCDEISPPMVSPEMVEKIKAGAEHAGVVLVATKSDELNLGICDLVEMRFNPARLMTVVNEKANVDEFEVLGYEVMSLARAALILSPGNSELCELLKDHEELIVEVSVCSPVVIGRSLSAMLLNGCEVIDLRRQGQAILMTEPLQMGDSVTLFGSISAISSASNQLNPRC